MFQVKADKYPVDILTAHYRVFGEIQMLGHPLHFLNGPTLSALDVNDATLMPIRTGVRIGAMSADRLCIPSTEPQILILGRRAPDETSPLPHSEHMVCFTDTYVVRGTFHLRPDTQLHDTFAAEHGPYFLATNLEIVTLYSVATEVSTMAEEAYIHGSAVRAFYALDS